MYEIEIEPMLLDERYDDQIQELLMFQRIDGKILDCGKVGSERIYEVLKELERNSNIKL